VSSSALQRTASMQLLQAARLAHSSSSRLAGRANHGTPLASICSTAARAVTELALLGRASYSIAAPLPGQRASSCWLAANSPSALLRPAPPAPRRKCSCMSHGHVRHRSLTLSRPVCGRSSPCGEDQVCWATDSQCETQRLLLLCRAAWFAQQRTFICFSSGGRPNIWSRRLCLANPYVAHRQLQTSHLITP
jgi:hypothetical protein